ncbi:MAG TPA: type II toxin-antitoxin system prevent-host-death family antitoxin [Longimicrobiaceae bacterium]|nr:type II toxin-antitoxin system prevent-host-death family antitoxin [Longimicrobiaceae bacterium]
MDDITVRDLRNHGGRVLRRVARGEALIVTLDGQPIAELRPIPAGALSATEILRRWAGLPRMDGSRLRADVDSALDSGL